MTTKTSEFGAQPPVQHAAPGAAATNANPSQRFDAFLSAFADGATHKVAAQAAGLTLAELAAWREADETHEDAYRIARKTRLMALHDAVWSEALGETVVDPVNGKSRVLRNTRLLERLAVSERELEPEKTGPAVAIQNNVGQPPAPSPELEAFAKRNTERLKTLLKRKQPAAITVEATPVDPDIDIIG